jgi:hypothetical protein
MLEFTLALCYDIQTKLERLLFTIRYTILIIKEQANIIYWRKSISRDYKDKKLNLKSQQR